jgi:hypothetical protein
MRRDAAGVKALSRQRAATFASPGSNHCAHATLAGTNNCKVGANVSDKSGTNPVGSAVAGAQAAGQVVGQAGAQAKQAGAQAAGQARDVAKEVQARGGAFVEEVESRAAAAAQAQKEGLAGRLDDVAKAVHRSGEQLEGHQDWIAGLVERGADELTTLANTLRTNDLRSLMGNLEDLARRQPALFVGASLAAGFALTRVGRVVASGASRADLPHAPDLSPEKSHERG